jgi:hypothetical protein
MTWFKVDDKLHAHPKAEKAGHEAIGLWCLAGSWCSDQLTDGHITEERCVRLIGDRKAALKLAHRLVDAGLWVRTVDGYQFHDWLHRNPSAQEVKAEKERKRKNVADYRQRRNQAEAEPVTGNKTGKQPPTFSVPDPDPDPRREDLKNTPPPLSQPETAREISAAAAVVTPEAPAERAQPEPAPTVGTTGPMRLWELDPATLAILETLTRSRKLRGLANPEYAQRLASHCREHGHTGPKPLALVLEAIQEADAKADAMEAGGEPIARMPAFVLACVKAGPKPGARPTAGRQPASDRWAPKTLDASTLPPLLSPDDPMRF